MAEPVVEPVVGPDEGPNPNEAEEKKRRKKANEIPLFIFLRGIYGSVVDLYIFLATHFNPAVEGPLHVFLVLFALILSNYFLGVVSTWFLYLSLLMAAEMAFTARERSNLYQTVLQPSPIESQYMEHAEWLNDKIEHIYFTIAHPAIFLILNRYVYPIVDPLINPLGVSFRVESLNLGTYAPRVEVMKRIVTNSTNNIIMDTRVKFVSNLEIILHIKFRGDYEMRIRASDLVLDLLARVEVQLHPQVPLESVVGLSLDGLPRFDLHLSLFHPHFTFDAMALPFVLRITRFVLQMILRQLLFLSPHYFCLTLLGSLVNGFTDNSNAPIVDIQPFFPPAEPIPNGSRLVGRSITGRHDANLKWRNAIDTSSEPVYLSYKRAEVGEQLSPIVALSLVSDPSDKEKRVPFRLPPGFELIRYTQCRKDASVSCTREKIYLIVLRMDQLRQEYLPPHVSMDEITPITQVGVKFKTEDRYISAEELEEEGWNCLSHTIRGMDANLSQSDQFDAYLYYKGGFPLRNLSIPPEDAAPITDIGVVFVPQEEIDSGWEVLDLDLDRKRKACLNHPKGNPSSLEQYLYLVVKRHGMRGPIVGVDSLLGDVKGGNVKGLKEGYEILRKTVGKAWFANVHRGSKESPCFICVKRAEFGKEEDLRPFNAIEVGIAPTASSVLTPPPGYEKLCTLNTGMGDLSQVVLFGRRISEQHWENIKQFQVGQEAIEQEDKESPKLGGGRIGGFAERRRPICHVALWCRSVGGVHGERPPAEWEIVEESYNHKHRFWINGSRKTPKTADLLLLIQRANAKNKQHVDAPISKVAITSKSSEIPRGWEVLDKVMGGSGDAKVGAGPAYLMVYRSPVNPIVALSYTFGRDLPLEEGWEMAEGSHLMNNDLGVVYMTEESYLKQKALREEREKEYIALPVPVTPRLSPAALLINEMYLCSAYPPKYDNLPIVDLAIINFNLEPVPPGFTRIAFTPKGHPACFNKETWGAPMYLCVKRGTSRPITEIGVVYGKELRIGRYPGWEVLDKTPTGRDASTNAGGDNKGQSLYVVFKRGDSAIPFIRQQPVKKLRAGATNLLGKIPLRSSGSGTSSSSSSPSSSTPPSPCGEMLLPLTDIQVLVPAYGEKQMKSNYSIIERSVSGDFDANLNAGTSGPLIRLATKRADAPFPYPEDSFDMTVVLTVVNARGLLAADANGFSDPFVEIECGGFSGKNPYLKKTLNPDWNYSFRMHKWGIGDCLVVRVWDRDVLDNDFLGVVRVSYFEALRAYQSESITLPLEGPDGPDDVSRGTITLKFEITRPPKVNFSSMFAEQIYKDPFLDRSVTVSFMDSGGNSPPPSDSGAPTFFPTATEPPAPVTSFSSSPTPTPVPFSASTPLPATTPTPTPAPTPTPTPSPSPTTTPPIAVTPTSSSAPTPTPTPTDTATPASSSAPIPIPSTPSTPETTSISSSQSPSPSSPSPFPSSSDPIIERNSGSAVPTLSFTPESERPITPDPILTSSFEKKSSSDRSTSPSPSSPSSSPAPSSSSSSSPSSSPTPTTSPIPSPSSSSSPAMPLPTSDTPPFYPKSISVRSLKDRRMGLLPITDVALYWVKTDCPIPSSVEGFTVIGQSVSNKYDADLNSSSRHFTFKKVFNKKTLPARIFLCYKRGASKPPITDIGIYLQHLNEPIPPSYTLLDKTIQNNDGNLNAGCEGATFKPYLAIQRKEGGAPLVEVGVVFKGLGEGVPRGWEVVEKSFSGQSGDVNPTQGARDGKMKILIGMRKEEEGGEGEGGGGLLLGGSSSSSRRSSRVGT